MISTPTVYYVILGIASVTVSILAYYSWTLGDGRRATILTALHLAIVVWCTGTLVRSVLAPDMAAVQAVTLPIGVAFILVPALWLVFVLEYTGYESILTRRNIALLFVVPIAAVPFELTYPYHSFFFETVATTDTYYGVHFEFGPVFDLVFLYHVAAMTVATVLLVRMLVTRGSIYRRQAALLLVASFVPWVGGAAFVLGFVKGDLTPVGFAVTGIAVIYAVKYESYVDIMPIARDTVVDRITSGVVVLDKDDRIIDINPKAREIFGRIDEAVIGNELADILPQSVLERYREVSPIKKELSQEFEIETAAGDRYFQVLVAPLEDGRGELLGRTMVINDITQQRRREEELRDREQELEDRKDELERQTHKLEHQNERLDDFASIVSHDLRNPLNVAMGNIQPVEEDLDGDAGDRVKMVRESLDRMGTIIEDALELARSGKAITENEEVGIHDVARDAWENVETETADLEIDGRIVMEADRDRLLSAFENLFRNAVEHGGSGVTVRVGDIGSGFYVEDDGEGIANDIRDEVLDRGFTTSDSGTGFGLAIVTDVVKAHGWTIDIDESDDGGARFIITPAES